MGGDHDLQSFVNVSLAETWEEEGESVDDDYLYARREHYGPEVPMGACLITAGVDVQDDRLEAEIVAWGPGEESGSMDYRVFRGDPGQAELWKRLDEFLAKPLMHESGVSLQVVAACIDTGGHYTDQVYRYTKARYGRCFAIKGVGGSGRPIVGQPNKNNKGKVPLFPVGVDTAKGLLFRSRFRVGQPGPGYCHFPVRYEQEYFHQLTAEKVVLRYQKGVPTWAWVKKTSSRRNEALDCRVYAMAALAICAPNLADIAAQLAQAVDSGQANLYTQTRRKGRRMLSRGI